VAEPDTVGADAFVRRAWTEVLEQLSAAPGDELGPVDLERMATAAYLTGQDDEAVAAWGRAYAGHLADGDAADAARCAFWAAFCLMLRGQMAHAGGWLQRSERAIGDDQRCTAAGLLRIPALLQALDADEPDRARDLAIEAAGIAAGTGDADLRAFATLGHGQALLAMGDHAAGIARFDDAMLSVSSGEVGPITTGIVYCAVVLECMQLFDLPRATEWTEALSRWCASQPDLVPYRGQCLVHQSQLQQAAGHWSQAVETAASAQERLTDPPHPALGLARYQAGELARLRGDHGAAAAAYRDASRAGYAPMPGLALLELARGETDAAAATIRRALAEAGQPFQRPRLLDAAVRVLVEARDVDAAAVAAAELEQIAAQARSDVLGAMADEAAGTVLAASGAPADALVRLRAAASTWQRLRMPYEAARSKVMVGMCCRALGDRTSSDLELDDARDTFRELGATPDVRRVDALLGKRSDPRPGGGPLSDRELEVLARVADGLTNREVADALSISPHTVGRHLENIFTKLGVGTRAAAIAHAYERHLL
jgi:DNA-binding CsgD family transcriptional regulator